MYQPMYCHPVKSNETEAVLPSKLFALHRYEKNVVMVWLVWTNQDHWGFQLSVLFHLKSIEIE